MVFKDRSTEKDARSPYSAISRVLAMLCACVSDVWSLLTESRFGRLVLRTDRKKKVDEDDDENSERRLGGSSLHVAAASQARDKWDVVDAFLLEGCRDLGPFAPQSDCRWRKGCPDAEAQDTASMGKSRRTEDDADSKADGSNVADEAPAARTSSEESDPTTPFLTTPRFTLGFPAHLTRASTSEVQKTLNGSARCQMVCLPPLGAPSTMPRRPAAVVQSAARAMSWAVDTLSCAAGRRRGKMSSVRIPAPRRPLAFVAKPAPLCLSSLKLAEETRRQHLSLLRSIPVQVSASPYAALQLALSRRGGEVGDPDARSLSRSTVTDGPLWRRSDGDASPWTSALWYHDAATSVERQTPQPSRSTAAPPVFEMIFSLPGDFERRGGGDDCLSDISTVSSHDIGEEADCALEEGRAETERDFLAVHRNVFAEDPERQFSRRRRLRGKTTT